MKNKRKLAHTLPPLTTSSHFISCLLYTSPHDVASILDMDHIAVRAGHHCAQPLLQHLNTSATTRASFAFYNTMEEVDALADSLAQVRRRMGYVD